MRLCFLIYALFISTPVLATDSQVLLSFLTKAECEFRPEHWAELGYEKCLFMAPLSDASREVKQLAHYKRWSNFLDEFMAGKRSIDELNQARTLVWYIERQEENIRANRSKRYIDVFFPLKAAHDHLVQLKYFRPGISSATLRQQFSSVFSTQRIEDEWLRVVIKQKENPEGIFTSQARIKTYLDQQGVYAKRLENLLGDAGKEFVKATSSYHLYLKNKVVPRAQVSHEVQRSWWQQQFFLQGGEGFLSKVSAESLEELSIIEAQLGKLTGEARPVMVADDYDGSPVQRFYLLQSSAYRLGWPLFVLPESPAEQRFVLQELKRALTRAHLAARGILDKVTREEARTFLQNSKLYTVNDLEEELNKLLFDDPLGAVLPASGYFSFKYIEEKMRLQWKDRFNRRCFQKALVRIGPLPWSQLEDSVRQSPECLTIQK
jgi:hypothetical protein